ncbi:MULTISPECIES: EH signature domain-containing protein [unclassified Bradyrhizobium]|nr:MULTISPECIES: EH signature domain-containing protein [unclassified Bradyrhizobium]
MVQPLPATSRTARLAAALSATGIGMDRRPTADLNTVADRFILSMRKGDEPVPGDWNKIAWCLWTTRPAIAEHDQALDAVLGRVARMERARPYRQLASAYLADFAPDRPRLDRVAGVLAAFAPKAGSPWDRAQTKFGIFDWREGAFRIARTALNEERNVQQLLESAGLGGALREGGFAKTVHDIGLHHLCGTTVTSATSRLEIIRRWCLRADDTFIFKDCSAGLARAVVLPFGDRVPPAVDRDLLVGFLVGKFGDPRVAPGRWIGMDDVAEILKRWLTEQSLRQFFDVLDKIAQPSHWRYRRAFWQAYFDHKPSLIRNAWVVFGSDGAAEAKRSFGDAVRFGVFRSGGRKQVLRGHAVLLMDLGQCVVADWSHTGYCTIWPNSDPTRPRNMNAESYTTSDVGRPLPKDLSEANLNRHDMFSHVGSENYVWQDRVAGRLLEMIGVRIPQYAYRVR